MRMRLKMPCTSETRTGRLRGSEKHADQMPHVERPLLSRPEGPEGTTILPALGSICGSPCAALTPQGWQGNLWGSATGNLTVGGA